MLLSGPVALTSLVMDQLLQYIHEFLAQIAVKAITLSRDLLAIMMCAVYVPWSEFSGYGLLYSQNASCLLQIVLSATVM